MENNFVIADNVLVFIQLVREKCFLTPEKTLYYLYTHPEVFEVRGVNLSFEDYIGVPSEDPFVASIWSAYATLLTIKERDDQEIVIGTLKALLDALTSCPTDWEYVAILRDCYTKILKVITNLNGVGGFDSLVNLCNSCNNRECCVNARYTQIDSLRRDIDSHRTDIGSDLPKPDRLLFKWLVVR